MNSRRSFLSLLSLAGVALAFPAHAFEFHPYVPSVVERAIASGEPVLVHVYAPWCLQCHAQAEILDRLKNDPAYGKIAFFRVDYDNQKDVVAKLNCPRSTFIAYKGGKEVARMSWDVTQDAVVKILKAAM
jgi:thioredoxin 1